MLEQISKISSVLMSIIGVLKLTEGSPVHDFLKWIPYAGPYFLKPVIDFICFHYVWLITLLFIVFIYRWIKDWRILALVGGLVAVFLANIL